MAVEYLVALGCGALLSAVFSCSSGSVVTRALTSVSVMPYSLRVAAAGYRKLRGFCGADS
jgi:hypothetical protein